MSISALKQRFQFATEKRKKVELIFGQESLFFIAQNEKSTNQLQQSETIRKTTKTINKEQSCTCLSIYIKCQRSDGSYKIIPQISYDQPLTH
mmetsp:Transcript_17979/g.20788  ORF Transcript_17979/g.20788 Transcript_17979/m.20788 type:complete len:92 (-) Transcript_17979:29-304(-)